MKVWGVGSDQLDLVDVSERENTKQSNRMYVSDGNSINCMQMQQ